MITEIPEVYFVACHPAAGAHFADFYYELDKRGKVRCRMIAAEKAAEELAKRGIPVTRFYEEKKPLKVLSLEEQEELASTVAKICKKATCVITDLGHNFSALVQKKLSEESPSIIRIAYYDNPETYVPGEYSLTVARTMEYAQTILFANRNLAQAEIFSSPGIPVDLEGKTRAGLGYANFKEIEELKEKRSCRKNQKFAVYFGGANEVYYTKAFPRFLEIVTCASNLQDLSDWSIVIQQHPRSVLEGNRDGHLLEEWKKKANERAPRISLSKFSFNDALTATDLALYYQTGAAAKFMLLGIPAAQVGHEPYLDILVRNQFCPTVTDEKQFLEMLDNLQIPSLETQSKIALESGIDPSWPEALEIFIEELGIKSHLCQN